MPKNKTGRRPISPDSRKSARVGTKITPGEHARLMAKLIATGQSEAEFIRGIVLAALERGFVPQTGDKAQ